MRKKLLLQDGGGVQFYLRSSLFVPFISHKFRLFMELEKIEKLWHRYHEKKQLTFKRLLSYCKNKLCLHTFLMFLKSSIDHSIDKGSQTHGPRAACGPPDVFVRPATSLKLFKLLIILRFLYYKGTSSLQLWPAETFFLLMRPASPFLLKCDPRMKLSLRPLL